MNLRDLRRMLLIAVGAMAAVFGAVSVLAAVRHSHPAATPSVPAPLAAGTALPRPRPVPAVQLVDAAGHVTSVRSWRGKWVILAPSMTLCHEVCPMTTGVLMELENRLRNAGLAGQVVVATATVDPWRDSPFRLRAYRRLTGAGFTQLTGSPAAIKHFWKFFGVFYVRVAQGHPPDVDWLTHQAETFDVDHTDALFLLDPAGQERIVDEGMPRVTGRLPPALANLLGAVGRHNLADPQFAWSASDVMDDLYHLMNRNIPAAAAPRVNVPSAAAAGSELTGSLGALAAIHRQAGQLLGPAPALAARLRGLRGYPVVINAWASWCPPCRSEFPLFAAAAARYGRRVAFLSVDTNDSAGNARSFLAAHPLSYPSYQSQSDQLGWLAQIEAMPTTVFVDRAGTVREVHSGQYDTEATLADDVQRLIQRR